MGYFLISLTSDPWTKTSIFILFSHSLTGALLHYDDFDDFPTCSRLGAFNGIMYLTLMLLHGLDGNEHELQRRDGPAT